MKLSLIKIHLYFCIYLFLSLILFNHHAYSNYVYIIVRSDGEKTFELENNNKIYFYTNIFNENKIKFKLNIFGILRNKEINCYTDEFEKDFVLKINELKKECKNAIYLRGQIDGKYFFYFGLKKTLNNNIDKKKALLVLPISNFYFYSNNLPGINHYNTYVNFIARLDEVPNFGGVQNHIYEFNTASTIFNLSKIINSYDTIYDYNFDKINIDFYDLVILPYHQEYISKNFYYRILKFLEMENKKILSIGGANFLREVTYENNILFINNKDSLLKQNFFNTWDFEKNKNCFFSKNPEYKLGDISEPKIKSNISYSLNYINCENNKVLPIISVQNFKKNSKFMHLMVSGLGPKINEIKELERKIRLFLNN